MQVLRLLFSDGTIGDKFSVVSISSTNTFKTQVRQSTITHICWWRNCKLVWQPTFGSGYNTGVTTNGVSVVTVFDLVMS